MRYIDSNTYTHFYLHILESRAHTHADSRHTLIQISLMTNTYNLYIPYYPYTYDVTINKQTGNQFCECGTHPQHIGVWSIVRDAYAFRCSAHTPSSAESIKYALVLCRHRLPLYSRLAHSVNTKYQFCYSDVVLKQTQQSTQRLYLHFVDHIAFVLFFPVYLCFFCVSSSSFFHFVVSRCDKRLDKSSRRSTFPGVIVCFR